MKILLLERIFKQKFKYEELIQYFDKVLKSASSQLNQSITNERIEEIKSNLKFCDDLLKILEKEK